MRSAMLPLLPLLPLLLAGSAVTACVSRPATPPAAPQATGEGAALPMPRADAALAPLAAIAAERVLLMPTQRVRAADSATAVLVRGDTVAMRRMDAALLAAFAERDVSAKWALPADAWRTFRRNPTVASDPYTLAVAPLLPANARRRRTSEPPPVKDPLASQLRTLAALTDARYVLVPAELRTETRGLAAGSGRTVLHLVLVDVRLSQIRWAGDVAGDLRPLVGADTGAATAARIIATRAAALVAGP